MTRSRIEKIMLLLTIVGALLSLYIYYTDVLNVPAICPTNGCALVAASSYSKFLGVSVSLWGLLYYLGGATLLMFKDFFLFKKYFKELLTLFITIGILFTIYLRVVEFFIIKALCVWCWGSVVVMVLLTVFYLIYLKNAKEPKSEDQTSPAL